MSQLVEKPALVRDRHHRPPDRTRFDAFPRHPAPRWGLRALFALPFMAVALVSSASPASSTVVSPNRDLIEHLSHIQWDRADISWVGDIFPPLSTLLAAVIPGGALGLAIAGSLVAGIFLQKMYEIMVQRSFAPGTSVILLVALAANPLFAYTVTENFAAFLGLAFFGLGMADIVRFVAWRNTQSGFRAGLLLMLSTLSDLSGLVYVLVAALAAPFLRLGRRNQDGARVANVLVIVFPTVASLGAIMVLNLIFVHDPLGSLGHEILSGESERWSQAVQLFRTLDGWLLIDSVLSAWIVALILRRPGLIPASTLVFVAIIGSFVLGFIPQSSAGNTFIIMTLMAIALIPRRREFITAVLMDLVAVLQIGIAWASAFNREIVVQWMHSLILAVNVVWH
jgi:hypothetical protein